MAGDINSLNLLVKPGIDNMLVRIANREDMDLQKQSDLVLPSLS